MEYDNYLLSKYEFRKSFNSDDMNNVLVFTFFSEENCNCKLFPQSFNVFFSFFILGVPYCHVPCKYFELFKRL